MIKSRYKRNKTAIIVIVYVNFKNTIFVKY